MARSGSGPAEVTSAQVVEVRHKAQFPGQRRNYNYVVRFNARDPQTGERLYVNEYRSIASNSPLSSETVLNRFVDLIESGLG